MEEWRDLDAKMAAQEVSHHCVQVALCSDAREAVILVGVKHEIELLPSVDQLQIDGIQILASVASQNEKEG